MAHATAQFFLFPTPFKRSNIIKSQSQSQFQRFLNQTLCVFSQLKDIKHIRRDFYSVSWVMPQGSDLGVPWGFEWSKKKSNFNQIWCVSNLHQWHMQRHNFFVPHPLGPCGGVKRSNIIKYQLQSQFQRFLNQTLCVFSQLKDIKHIRRDFYSVSWDMPQGGTWGFCGGLGRPKTFFSKFNQICCVSYLHEWHMQRHNLLGPRLLGPWGGVKRSNIIKYQLQSQFQRFLN